MDYAALREKMVREQLLSRGIKDEKILAAFKKVERHKFVSEELAPNGYSDFPLPIGSGQTISQPYIVALMTEALALNGTEKVLEVGAGSGYQLAILAELCKEVYGIERIELLSRKASVLLAGVGVKNAKVKTGDGTLGWPEEAPFDRIVVTAASPEIPLPLIEQLGMEGKLVLPLGGPSSQILTVLEKKRGLIESRQICGCSFVPLIGKFASP
ncbi:MAG: protein-L-isoaspartate O-methyltransferase [Omnitrophica WOR_2 bacterium RIFCSPLOWO2_12_FULL_51_8]|nr:MAG: protein-L-isoaspartate O-methyltransferase [Omnitrophica WOR_2 bacterium RIFCSPLOWO2_12_FULL_51_8]